MSWRCSLKTPAGGYNNNNNSNSNNSNKNNNINNNSVGSLNLSQETNNYRRRNGFSKSRSRFSSNSSRWRNVTPLWTMDWTSAKNDAMRELQNPFYFATSGEEQNFTSLVVNFVTFVVLLFKSDVKFHITVQPFLFFLFKSIVIINSRH